MRVERFLDSSAARPAASRGRRRRFRGANFPGRASASRARRGRQRRAHLRRVHSTSFRARDPQPAATPIHQPIAVGRGKRRRDLRPGAGGTNAPQASDRFPATAVPRRGSLSTDRVNASMCNSSLGTLRDARKAAQRSATETGDPVKRMPPARRRRAHQIDARPRGDRAGRTPRRRSRTLPASARSGGDGRSASICAPGIDHRALLLRRRQHLHRHLHQRRQRAHRTGQQLRQIIAGDVLHHLATGLELLAQAVDRTEAEKMIARGRRPLAVAARPDWRPARRRCCRPRCWVRTSWRRRSARTPDAGVSSTRAPRSRASACRTTPSAPVLPAHS